jgi:transcriptional repressor NrdR
LFHPSHPPIRILREEASKAVLCPACRSGDTRVIDSRDDENAVRRRRECQSCKHRFTTFERPEAPRLYVVKKDGRREAYNREKILGGLRKASEKRPISESEIQEVADRVERELYARGESEVPSTVVGDLVMAELRRLDKVAYIRFASVYRSFGDLDSFQEELAQLRAKSE